MDVSTMISKYLQSVGQYFVDENSSEMSYRTPFENLLKEIFPAGDGYKTQHDQRAINGNKPDFIVFKNEIPILYIEVKKVGEDLDKIEKSSQAARYFGYDNLIISDYLSFRFYRNGIRYDEPIALAISNPSFRTLSPRPDNHERLVRTVLDFTHSHKEPIKSGKHLAKIMGGKAQRIRDNTVDFLNSDSPDSEELKKIMAVIKQNLVSDIDAAAFADMYAQTLVYGLFAARYNDKSANTFSRQEARELVPATNPFLQHFFDHIAGAHFPKRLDRIVTELCEVFSHANVKNLMQEYFKKTDLRGKNHESPDPVIHFYEDFLHEYDPSKKMEMGVFYTPLPVVRFIVRSVDSLLKKEFGITRGLADDQKIQVAKKELNKKGKEVTVQKEYSKVQVLDVATGTGTFLNEVIRHVHSDFIGQEGRWPTYAQESLIPRLHGFELMMASYTIAHLKLGMTLQETGVNNLKGRLGVYLTNTLDEAADYSNQGNLFGLLESIADESKSASRIKKEYPIMVVIGNPPYSGISQNKHYTDNNVYKVEPGGLEKLKEKKNWLDDDYVKFLRFAESFVEKNQEGVIGMITSHGYLDNPTFRGMRWHLRSTFDSIYVLDLHGNSNKKETSPDGSKDVNIFDIKTGVSIILGVKKQDGKADKKLAQIYQADLYGTREYKNEQLDMESVSTIHWKELPHDTEAWRIESSGRSEYSIGLKIETLFPVQSMGVTTARDSVVIGFDRKEVLQRIEHVVNNDNSDDQIRQYLFPGKKNGKYRAGDTRGWKLSEARIKIKNEDHSSRMQSIAYRPFDTREIYYDSRMVDWGREKVMRNFLNRNNVGLCCVKLGRDAEAHNFFVTDKITDKGITSSLDNSNIFPLYILDESGLKIPNLDSELWNVINNIAGKTTPEDILDYVYAYLYSPTYRENNKDFLKTNFPHIPFPKLKEEFWAIVPMGTKLRSLHLLTDPSVNKPITSYSVAGSNEVEKITYKNGSVYINETQFFGNVPEVAWKFYIGGYQPAQKYLKDRKGKVLTDHDIHRWQQMIVALTETDKIMKEIDEVIAL